LDRRGQTLFVAGVRVGDAVLDEYAAFEEKALLNFLRRRAVQADPIPQPTGMYELIHGRKQRPTADYVQRDLMIPCGGTPKRFD
jgi:hypothetical protein